MIRYNLLTMQKFSQDILAFIGFQLSPRQTAAFSTYEKLLLEWNEKINLTAIRDTEGIRAKHFLDSLSILPVINGFVPQRVVDIGTGAGFPGIPLKIVCPSIQLTLVESVGKKADFCRLVIAALGLERVEVLQMRAEDMGQDPRYREKFDLATARAVANLPILSEFLLPLVRVGGNVVAQKGENGPAEAQAAEKAIHLLGGRLAQVKHTLIPGVVEERFLILIQKVATTPPQYPRRPGIPAKKPIL
ncbi:MAG: 16S rRNA (guanine(527)-N(7))-methyltransferase RsmG [Anaerolineaceae bacterium]